MSNLIIKIKTKYRVFTNCLNRSCLCKTTSFYQNQISTPPVRNQLTTFSLMSYVRCPRIHATDDHLPSKPVSGDEENWILGVDILFFVSYNNPTDCNRPSLFVFTLPSHITDILSLTIQSITLFNTSLTIVDLQHTRTYSHVLIEVSTSYL